MELGVERVGTRPMRHVGDEVALHRVAERVDLLPENIFGLDEADRGGLFHGPEVFPPSPVTVEGAGNGAVEVVKEGREPAVAVAYDHVEVVRHDHETDDLDAEAACGLGEAVDDDLPGRLAGLQQELAPRAAAAEEVVAARKNLTRSAHIGLSPRARSSLRSTARMNAFSVGAAGSEMAAANGRHVGRHFLPGGRHCRAPAADSFRHLGGPGPFALAFHASVAIEAQPRKKKSCPWSGSIPAL
jgi:hypothetical protein